MKTLIRTILSLLLCLTLLAGTAAAASADSEAGRGSGSVRLSAGSQVSGTSQSASGTQQSGASQSASGTQQSGASQSASGTQQSGAAESSADAQQSGPVKTAESGWVYMKNGKTDDSFTGITATTEGWLYFKNGVFDPLYCGIVSNENGKWYVRSGTIAWTYSGIATFQQKQWYIRYGQVVEDYLGMLYMQDTWYFINEGIAWHYTGDAKSYQYGVSESGRPLTVYRYGTGKNVLLLNFAIHGYEDAYAADGDALVYAAFRLMHDLDDQTALIDAGNWSIYIVPCANPDGLLDGTSVEGTGRRTAASSSKDGTKYSSGIDLNRSFPFQWQRYTGGRNYNGSTSLFSSESRALYRLTTYVQGDATNICVDVHGWYNEIITAGMDNGLYQIFQAGFPGAGYSNLMNAHGYYSAWAHSIGYNACLFEFPAGIHSFEDFRNIRYTDQFIGCVLNILKYYGK